MNGDTNKCLKFYYYMRTDEKCTLDVLTKSTSGSVSSSLWSRNKDYGENWNYGEINIKSNENFQAIFQATPKDSWLGTFALDDVYFEKGSCNQSSLCDLESGLSSCSWFNVQGLFKT